MLEETMQFVQTDEFGPASPDDVRASDTEKYLIFVSDGLLYGIKTDYVMDIITQTPITHLPMLPEHIRGVINLRGQIVPILDLRLLLGRKPGDTYCTIVLNIDGTQLSVLTDRVEQIVDLPKGSILPVPSQNAPKLISGMCTLPNGGGTMMVLDCGLLRHA
ncbi:MAG: chemotaxis protein CheW [Lawsonibacter sp.]